MHNSAVITRKRKSDENLSVSEMDTKDTIQGKSSSESRNSNLDLVESENTIQRKESGLPEPLKSNMESMSGYALDDVDVNYNSDKPAQLNAKAYAKGNNIEIGPGEEEHLPHEAWHVVQQKQDRVKPNAAIGGEAINNDEGLETEADVMGAKANSLTAASPVQGKASNSAGLVQREEDEEEEIEGAEIEDEDLSDDLIEDAKEGDGVSRTDSFDGKTRKRTAKKTETKKGIDPFTIESISRISDDKIVEGAKFAASAGVFGESARAAAIERGALKASAKGSASGGAGAQTEGAALSVVEFDPDSPDVVNKVRLLATSSAKVGSWGELAGELKANYGPVGVEAAAKISAFVGVAAEMKGELGFDRIKKEVSAKGSVSAMAGAKAEGEASAKLIVGPVEAETKIEGEAFAGAKAEASGQAVFSPDSILLSGTAEAFAGVSASAKGSAEIGYKGRTLFSASGKVEVSAGAGGKVGGKFEFKNGKLSISGSLAATLGIGGGVDFSAEVDFIAIKDAVADLIASGFSKLFSDKKEEKDTAPEPVKDMTPEKKSEIDKNYKDALRGDFQKYQLKKAGQGKNTIKAERVQEIINLRIMKNPALFASVNSQEASQAIIDIAKEMFSKELDVIEVSAGKITKFVTKPEAEKPAPTKSRFSFW